MLLGDQLKAFLVQATLEFIGEMPRETFRLVELQNRVLMRDEVKGSRPDTVRSFLSEILVDGGWARKSDTVVFVLTDKGHAHRTDEPYTVQRGSPEESALASRLEELTHEQEELEEKLRGAEETARQLRDELSRQGNLRQAVEDQAATVARLEETIRSLKLQLKGQKTRGTSVPYADPLEAPAVVKRIKGLKARIDQLKGEHANQLREQDEEIARLEEELERFKTEIERLKKDKGKPAKSPATKLAPPARKKSADKPEKLKNPGSSAQGIVPSRASRDFFRDAWQVASDVRLGRLGDKHLTRAPKHAGFSQSRARRLEVLVAMLLLTNSNGEVSEQKVNRNDLIDKLIALPRIGDRPGWPKKEKQSWGANYGRCLSSMARVCSWLRRVDDCYVLVPSEITFK